MGCGAAPRGKRVYGGGGRDGGQRAGRERLNGVVLGGPCKQAKRSDSRKVPGGDRELEESGEASGCTGRWMAGCKLCALWHMEVPGAAKVAGKLG